MNCRHRIRMKTPIRHPNRTPTAMPKLRRMDRRRSPMRNWKRQTVMATPCRMTATIPTEMLTAIRDHLHRPPETRLARPLSLTLNRWLRHAA